MTNSGLGARPHSLHIRRHLNPSAHSPGLRPLVHAVSLAICGALLSTTGSARAEAIASPSMQTSATYTFNIPAGPLAPALRSFASTANVLLTFTAEQTDGKITDGIKGPHTASSALNALLAGTGLQAATLENGSYLLRPAPAVQPPKAKESITTLPEVSVVASSDRESQAVSEGTGSYAARAVSIGKGEQSLRDIPQSVSVMTRQRMDDQNLTSLDSALGQVTGVTKEFRNYGHTVYYSRGFALDNFMTDGVPMGYYGGIGIAPDTAIFDRIEVLRGAPGLLIGNGDPGGTVNMVRKRPLAEKQMQITARAGSWDYYRLDGDITGPLNDAGTLRGRLLAGYEDRHYFYDEAQTKLPLLYGMLEADLGEKTVAAVGARYQHYSQQGGRWAYGLPISSDGSDLGLSRSTSYGPGWTYFKSTVREVFGDITHHINDDWSVKLTGTAQLSERQDAAIYNENLPLDPNNLQNFYLRGADFEDNQYRTRGADAQLHGKFGAWGQEHQLFLGANWQKEETLSYKGSRVTYSSPILIDPRSPDLSALARLYSGPYGTPISGETTTQGFYGNLKLQVSAPLKVILGGRVSWYENSLLGITQSKETHQVTPYVAAILRLNNEWSAYGSYTDVFRPQSNSYTASGTPLNPALGSNYEAGIKGEFAGGKLNTSFALFRINMDDLAQTDPRNPTSCPGTPAQGGCSINGGKLKSEGFDAEINGEILPRLQVFAGYTYNTAKYVRDRDATGNPTANEGGAYQSSFIPRQLLRSWMTYQLPGAWEKFTVGGGVNLQSEIYTQDGTVRYTQEGYAVWNASASYRVDKHWTATININNVFDKHYYTVAGNYWYGEPQSMMLTLRGTF
ncbi:TonB-dependent siderophore receptor [Methylovorus glucosotrophus]|uniref:TonB-dependent siderophore receptor n=1 Tax=Methylovorus glucosotrophus (strain SIP3-4) TaxID=582744 RepID=C6XBX7_METGS|nr:TonB-dependent receptor [Methylovorus glucosotrophus]ACT50052.1 TonB-dependent siderophore receptor [Methylovorus glucosotrophus SIP3-4]